MPKGHCLARHFRKRSRGESPKQFAQRERVGCRTRRPWRAARSAPAAASARRADTTTPASASLVRRRLCLPFRVTLTTTVTLAPANAPSSAPSCSSFAEFLPLVQAVTAACCTAGVECPAGGIPSTCTAECAAVLLPMQVRAQLSSCLRRLPASASSLSLSLSLSPPPPPLPSFPPLGLQVTHYPVRPQRGCADMLAANNMASIVNSAVATCPPNWPVSRAIIAIAGISAAFFQRVPAVIVPTGHLRRARRSGALPRLGLPLG